MNNDQDDCLSDESNQSQPLMGPMKRFWPDKLNPSHCFNFGLKGLIDISILMFLGLLSIIWLKRLITQEAYCYKKEKFLNTFFIKYKKEGDVGNSQDPQSLLKGVESL
jgi:hypothetical protein